MKYLALQIPGNYSVTTNLVPTGGPSSLANIISTGLNLAIVVAILVCLFMFILGGFNWILSQGDKQKIAQARQRLVMSILGLAVIFMSFIIINIIYTFFFGGAINFLGSQ
jgi:hypothetical protein